MRHAHQRVAAGERELAQRPEVGQPVELRVPVDVQLERVVERDTITTSPPARRVLSSMAAYMHMLLRSTFINSRKQLLAIKKNTVCWVVVLSVEREHGSRDDATAKDIPANSSVV